MRTTTTIHSEALMKTERAGAFMRDQFSLNGMLLYAQLTLGTALYLIGHTSTPSYLSILAAIPLAVLLIVVARKIEGAAAPGASVLHSVMPPILAAAVSILLALSLLIDGQIVLYCFCAIVTHILPQSSLVRIAVTVSVAVPLAIHHGDESALGRLAGFLGFVLIAVILLTFITALPYGNVGHLFPLFGKGVDRMFSGFVWISGAAACTVAPYLLPTNKPSLDMLRGEKKRRLLKPICVMIGAALSALMRSYLLPYYALARPDTLGSQLLIVPEVSPSILGWSLYMTVILLLLVIVFSAAVTQASSFLRDGFQMREVKSTLTPFLLALATVPLAALNLESGKDILLRIAPYRLALTGLALAVCGACLLLRKKGGAKA